MNDYFADDEPLPLHPDLARRARRPRTLRRDVANRLRGALIRGVGPSPDEDRRPRYRFSRVRQRLLMTVVDGFLNFALAILRLVGLGPRKPLPESLRPIRSILLIQLDHLGDAVLSLPVLPILKRRWPEARIEVLAQPANAAIFAGRPEVSRVRVCRWNRFARDAGRRWWPLGVFGWGWKLRGKYDLAFDLRGEFPHAVLMFLAGIPRRIGWNAAGGGPLLTASAEYLTARHEVASRLALLESGGVVLRPEERSALPRWHFADENPGDDGNGRHPEDRSSDPRPHFADADAFDIADRSALRASAPIGGPRLMFHLGAGAPAKVWPFHHWQSLLERQLERGATIELVGGPAEKVTAERLLEALGRPDRLHDLTDRLSIAELAERCRTADLFVGADSGPAHVAAATGCRTLVLFSGVCLPQQWRPPGPHVSVLQERVECSPCRMSTCRFEGHPCMARLAPSRVGAEIARLLAPVRSPQAANP